MKKFSSVICLSLLVILLLINPVMGSSEWVKYYDDINGNIRSYNKNVSIEKNTGNHIIQVWDKVDYSKNGKKQAIQQMAKLGTSTKTYDKLSHNTSLYEIDCKKRRFRVLQLLMYDEEGNTLYYHQYNEDWVNLPPDTKLDLLRKQVCK